MAKKAVKQPTHLRVRVDPKLLSRLERAREANGNTLTGEIVDRLEASYAKDERIEELKKRLDQVRPSIDAVRAAYDKDRERFDAEAEDRHREIEALRDEIAKFHAGLAALEAEVAMHQAAEAVFETFVGEDPASKEAARGVAILLAANPGWAANAEGVQKVTQSIGAIIQAAVNKGGQQ